MSFRKIQNRRVRQNHRLKERRTQRYLPVFKLGKPQKKTSTLNITLPKWKKTSPDNKCKHQEYIYKCLYKKKSGQALMETLALLPLASSCFILCLLFFHVHAQHLWMDHQLYQSLVCMAKGQTKPYCENQMEKKVKTFLWTGRLKNIQLYKTKSEWKGSFVWNTRFWKIRFRQKLHLKKGVLL